MAAGKCWLEIHEPWGLDGYRAAELVSDLTGQPFRFSHRRL